MPTASPAGSSTINAGVGRFSPEVIDQAGWSDSAIGCSLDLHNFSTKDLSLDPEMFTHYNWIEILRKSDGKQAGSLSANPPLDVQHWEYFDLPAQSTKNLSAQYGAFACLHGEMTAEGGVRYDSTGDFVIFHKRFPVVQLEFSVDSEGIVRPKFDQKIQEGIGTRPE